MAITRLESDTVSRGFNAAKLALEQLKPVVDSLDVIYNSSGGVKDTLTQGDLDGVPSFSGITKGQVDDGVFALMGIKTAIANAYTALAEFAARA